MIAVAKRARLPAERPRAKPAPRPSLTVGIITSDSFGRFSIPIVEGLEEQLSDAGIAVFMCNGADDPERERRTSTRCSASASTASSSPPARRQRAARRHMRPGIPVLYVYSQSDEPGALGLVPDDEGGAVLAVEHLADLGRRRIAHVTGPERFEAVRLRSAAGAPRWRAGLPEPPALLGGEWSEAWGRRPWSGFSRRATAPDALFCGNDQIARGMADALRERGDGIPGTCRSSASTIGR